MAASFATAFAVPALAQEPPAPPQTPPPATRPLGPGDPLPEFLLNYRTLSGTFLGGSGRAIAEAARLTWGDLRVTADRIEYDADAPDGPTVTATGNVVVVRGDERFETSGVTFRLDEGGFTAARAVAVSPPFFVAANGRIERRAGVLVAEDARLTTCPEGRGELAITAARITVDQNDNDILFKDATLRLFGARLFTVRSLRVALPGGTEERRDLPTLPISVRTSRISGFAVGANPTFRVAPRTDLDTQFFVTARRGLQSGVTLRRELLDTPGAALPRRTGAAGLLGGGGGEGTDADPPGESPLRRLLRARTVPAPDPLLDYESVSVAFRTGNAGPGAVAPPLQNAGREVDAELTGYFNQEIGGKRQGLLLLSRLPEARLIGRLPLGGPRAPSSADPAALRAFLRTPRPVVSGQASYGSYRERRLEQDRATVRADRTALTVGLETLPLLIGDRLTVRPRITATQHWYEGGARYGFGEMGVSAQYTLGQRTAFGAAYLSRTIDGETPFTFDEVDTRSEAQFWAQGRSGRFTLFGLARYDTEQKRVFDYELAVAVRGRCIEPRLSFRKLGNQFGVGVALPGLTTF